MWVNNTNQKIAKIQGVITSTKESNIGESEEYIQEYIQELLEPLLNVLKSLEVELVESTLKDTQLEAEFMGYAEMFRRRNSLEPTHMLEIMEKSSNMFNDMKDIRKYSTKK